MTEGAKFADLDQKFIARRTEFLAGCDLDAAFLIDNWGLFSGAVPITTFLARYELLKLVTNVPGHILEFGVFNGANLLFMAKVLSALAPGDLKLFFGFDNWEGLKAFDTKDGKARAETGSYKGRKDVLQDMIALHGLGDRIRLRDGLVEESLPRFLKENPHYVFSLIYLDTDLYASTKVALDACWSRLMPGGVIAFDQGYHDRFPGEGTALVEFMNENPGAYESGSFPFARQPMLWLRKK